MAVGMGAVEEGAQVPTHARRRTGGRLACAQIAGGAGRAPVRQARVPHELLATYCNIIFHSPLLLLG